MGICKGRLARAATVAGLGFALAAGALLPSIAIAATGAADTPVSGEYANPDYSTLTDEGSTAITKLYITARHDDIAAPVNADVQFKVSVPVAIHYVADSAGNLVGPTDNVVKFQNNTAIGSAHVSKIQVKNAGGISIAPSVSGETNQTDNQAWLFMTPAKAAAGAASGTNGTPDEFGTHQVKSDPAGIGDWDMDQKGGQVYLNGLTGKLGGLSGIDASGDLMVGSVHWTLRSGTRAQADVQDDTLTVHYNVNNGSYKDNAAIPDTAIRVSTGAGAIHAGDSVVVPPPSRTNLDGTLTEYEFEGWYTAAGSDGDEVATASDAITAAGGASSAKRAVLELYAHYTAKA